jgi:hypothetical protein
MILGSTMPPKPGLESLNFLRLENVPIQLKRKVYPFLLIFSLIKIKKRIRVNTQTS